jgi:hypothetical protein
MALLIMSPVSEMVSFGLKPGNCVVFNCPDLKVGAIDVRDIQGFSHIFLIFDTFLNQIQPFKPDSIMKTLTLSLRTTTIIMRILAVILMIYLIIELFHLFDSSVVKGIFFYYSLIIAIGYFISAIGMWKSAKWSVYLYFVTTIALIPAFIYLNSWDNGTILIFLIVLIGVLTTWRNLK